MKHNRYEKIENHIEKIISANMSIKTVHGLVYDVRNISIGDSTIFNINGKELSVELQVNSFDVRDILSASDDWLDKSDKIAFKIINEIDSRVLKLIDDFQVSTRLKTFKNCVKIVIENSIIVTDFEAHIKFGVAVVID